jgi:hypothetical protein
LGDSLKVSPSLVEIFNDFFPFYLSIGMTYDQFWNDDPLLVKSYLKANEYKSRRRNEEMWLQGVYFGYAIASIMDKNSKYPDVPLPLTKKEQLEQEEHKKRVHFEQLKAKMVIASQMINRNK